MQENMYSSLQEQLLRHLPFRPSAGQAELAGLLVRFAFDPGCPSIMLLNGHAGTGKTSVTAAFAQLLHEHGRTAVLLAPTGRAAKVLSDHTGKRACTIHKQIYRRQTSSDAFSQFVLNYNKADRAVFLVDEASMIAIRTDGNSQFGSGDLLEDLVRFIDNHRGCRLLLSGDTAQLPPVGLEDSPALDAGFMSQYAGTVMQYTLTEVARQAAESGILHNAIMLRQLIAQGMPAEPAFRTEGFHDIAPVSGSDLMELLTDAYDRTGQENTIVVCWSNRRANRYNEGIRNRILYREEELTSGDVLMVVRNNYFWPGQAGLEEELGFIANGDTLRVRRIHRFIDRYGFHFADADVILTDYNQEIRAVLLLDVLHTEQNALSGEEQKRLYYTILEDYAHLSRPQQREAMKKDPFYNALQVKYAYAVTGHKAQGGQWHTVFVDNGWYSDGMPDRSYLRWLYTALTRATDRVYLVNFPQKFLLEE